MTLLFYSLVAKIVGNSLALEILPIEPLVVQLIVLTQLVFGSVFSRKIKFKKNQSRSTTQINLITHLPCQAILLKSSIIPHCINLSNLSKFKFKMQNSLFCRVIFFTSQTTQKVHPKRSRNANAIFTKKSRESYISINANTMSLISLERKLSTPITSDEPIISVMSSNNVSFVSLISSTNIFFDLNFSSVVLGIHKP